MRILIVLFVASLALWSCNNASTPVSNEENTAAPQQNMSHVKALEIIQTSSYTYLRVDDNGMEKWIAVTKIDAAVGDEFYFSKAMEMIDFQSTELNRVFPSVFFVEDLSSTPTNQMESQDIQNSHVASQNLDASIVIDPIEGGVTVADIFKNRNQFQGKKVLVKGKVMKVNNEIMGKNWIHIQDGTADGENFDLTITTSETVLLNDIVIFEGVIYLDKDFGAGYKYDLIMEDAIKK